MIKKQFRKKIVIELVFKVSEVKNIPFCSCVILIQTIGMINANSSKNLLDLQTKIKTYLWFASISKCIDNHSMQNIIQHLLQQHVVSYLICISFTNRWVTHDSVFQRFCFLRIFCFIATPLLFALFRLGG